MSAWHRSTTCWMLIGLTPRELAANLRILLIVKNIQSSTSSMRPDKNQSGIDALRILVNAVGNDSDIHIRSNGDIREKRFDEKV